MVAWIVDDTGFAQERNSLRWGRASVLRTGGQARKLPGRGEFVVGYRTGQSSRSRGACTCQRFGLRIVSAARRRAFRERSPLPPSRRSRFSRFGKQWREEVIPAPVLADAAYGNDSQFREGLTELGLEYVVGVQKSTTVWRPGEAPLPAKRWKGRGRPPTLLRRDKHHQPISVKQLAESLGSQLLGKMFPGAREPSRDSVRALRRCVFVWLIGIIGEANSLRRNGC